MPNTPQPRENKGQRLSQPENPIPKRGLKNEKAPTPRSNQPLNPKKPKDKEAPRER